MSYIRTTDLAYPLSERDIQLDNPTYSCGNPWLPPEGYAWVFPTPIPEHDPITQTVVEMAPVLSSKGEYEQAWQVNPRFVQYVDKAGITHTIEEQVAAAIESDRKAKVPTSISIRQAKLALLQAGLLDDVEAAIAQANRAIQIEWEYAIEFKRDWPTLLALQPILGLTDRQIDDLFVLASTL